MRWYGEIEHFYQKLKKPTDTKHCSLQLARIKPKDYLGKFIFKFCSDLYNLTIAI